MSKELYKNNLFIKKDYVSNATSNLIITHGLAEHLELYDEFVKYLNDNNINVIRYDLLGHGKSGGKRGYISNIRDFLNSLHFIVNEIKNDNPLLKTFLFGHSLGAGISNIYALNYNDIDGVVSNAAPAGLEKGKEYLRFIPLFLIKVVKIKVNLSREEDLSNNLEYVKKYKMDQGMLKYFFVIVPACVIKYLDNAIRKGKKNTNIPFLFTQGKKDGIVKYEVPLRFYNHINSIDKEFFIQEDGRHNLLSDLEKEETFEKIASWILSRS